MTFLHQMLSAKQGDNYAVEFLLEMYRPLLVKEAIVDGIFDEDLYQELCMQVPSRFMRKIVCRLRLSEVNRQ